MYSNNKNILEYFTLFQSNSDFENYVLKQKNNTVHQDRTFLECKPCTRNFYVTIFLFNFVIIPLELHFCKKKIKYRLKSLPSPTQPPKKTTTKQQNLSVVKS